MRGAEVRAAEVRAAEVRAAVASAGGGKCGGGRGRGGGGLRARRLRGVKHLGRLEHVEDEEVDAGHEQLHWRVVDAGLVDANARLTREIDLGLGKALGVGLGGGFVWS